MSAYRLTKAAADDVVAIFIDGFARFGQARAEAYHDGLLATFAFLARYPRAARLREEITPPVRVHRYRSHLVVYRLDVDETVIVLRIRHGREDWLGDGE